VASDKTVSNSTAHQNHFHDSLCRPPLTSNLHTNVNIDRRLT